MQLLHALGHGKRGVSPDGAAGDEGEMIGFRSDDAPAGALQSRIDAQDHCHAESAVISASGISKLEKTSCTSSLSSSASISFKSWRPCSSLTGTVFLGCQESLADSAGPSAFSSAS